MRDTCFWASFFSVADRLFGLFDDPDSIGSGTVIAPQRLLIKRTWGIVKSV
jgi:hypothetical protein